MNHEQSCCTQACQDIGLYHPWRNNRFYNNVLVKLTDTIDAHFEEDESLKTNCIIICSECKIPSNRHDSTPPVVINWLSHTALHMYVHQYYALCKQRRWKWKSTNGRGSVSATEDLMVNCCIVSLKGKDVLTKSIPGRIYSANWSSVAAKITSRAKTVQMDENTETGSWTR